jgi:anti-sigma factor RsiW
MKCPSPDSLRALQDGEASAEQAAALREHLAGCVACRGALERERALQQRVAGRMALLGGPEGAAQPALARFHATHDLDAGETPWERWKMNTMRRWRPLAAGAMVVVMALVLVAVPPARAVARQFLALFRVQQVVVLPVSPDALRDNPALEAIEERLDRADVRAVAAPDPVAVEGRAEAEAMSGFSVREPAALPGNGDTTYEVVGYTQYVMSYSRDMLVMLYELAGMDASLVPEDLPDGDVSVVVEGAVRISRGRTEVLQAPSPVVEYPEGIDARTIGEAGLRVLGYAPDDARALSERIDWTATAVVPVPVGEVVTREVTVAGAEGLLLVPTGDTEWSEASVLVWERDGILYMVRGPLDQATLLDIAESMF